jgi:hypothetical protein
MNYNTSTMRKFLKITVLAILVVIIAFYLISYLIWFGYPKRTINLMVLDKTVPTFDYHEHKSLFWILNNTRFVKSDGESYSYKKDYFGFFPLKPISNKQYDIKHIALEQIEPLSNEYDAMYYVDAYGVLYKEWFRGFSTEDDNSIIDGGINQNEYLFMKAMKEKHKLIIAEFNTLGSPTSELIRYKTEELLGVRATGWYGSYFKSLKENDLEDIPSWVVTNYKNANNGIWPFKGSGIILLNNYKNIIVLDNDKLASDYPVIETSPENAKKYSLPEKIEYANWFEIVETADSSDVISTCTLLTNNTGDSLLNVYSLPTKFNIVSCYNKNNTHIYYFAGDFADNNVHSMYARMANSRKLLSSLNFSLRKEFFYQYYFPLVESVLNNYKDRR